MNLDEAIDRYTNNAEYERTHGSLHGCLEFRQLAEWLKDYKRLLEQQPCEDAISRQAAIDKIKEIYEWHDNVSKERIIEHFKRLPSVTPQQKYGKWIDGKCNKCGTHAPFWSMATTYYCSEYCPKCGAKMQESEDKE